MGQDAKIVGGFPGTCAALEEDVKADAGMAPVRLCLSQPLCQRRRVRGLPVRQLDQHRLALNCLQYPCRERPALLAGRAVGSLEQGAQIRQLPGHEHCLSGRQRLDYFSQHPLVKGAGQRPRGQDDP